MHYLDTSTLAGWLGVVVGGGLGGRPFFWIPSKIRPPP
jgi:hypothetical protein